jgi:hypothetical protein
MITHPFFLFFLKTSLTRKFATKFKLSINITLILFTEISYLFSLLYSAILLKERSFAMNIQDHVVIISWSYFRPFLPQSRCICICTLCFVLFGWSYTVRQQSILPSTVDINILYCRRIDEQHAMLSVACEENSVRSYKWFSTQNRGLRRCWEGVEHLLPQLATLTLVINNFLLPIVLSIE